MLLPLDNLTEEAKKGLEYHDINPDDIRLAVEVDLTSTGKYGDTWLLIDEGARKLYYMGVETDRESALAMTRANQTLGRKAKNNEEYDKMVKARPQDLEKFRDAEFRTYDLDRFAHAFIESFITSCQLLTICKEDRENEEEIGVTIVIANSTNARKKRLFAFLDVFNRIIEGESPTEEDPIFEQFNARCPKCGKVYPNQNTKICPDCNKRGQSLRRLFKYVGKYKVEYALIFLMMFASSVMSLVSPYISGTFIYDNVLNPESDMHTVGWVWVAVGVLFGLFVLSNAISIIQSRANNKVSHRMLNDMKLDVYNAIMRMSMSYYSTNSTGRLRTRIDSDPTVIRSFFTGDLPNMIVNAIKFVGLTIFCFYLNWKLTLIVFIPVPIIFFIFKVRLPKLWRMYSLIWRRSSTLNSVMSGALGGIRVVKAFAQEEEETNRFHKVCEKLYTTTLEQQKLSMTIGPLISILISVTSMLIWGFGGLEVMGETMTYGEFTAYIGYVGMVFAPISFFSSFTVSVTNTINSANRMFEVLDEIPELADVENPIELESINGDIEFKKVCFHYNPNRPILKDVTMTIHSNDNIGLVGHTGSGKTTIANLMSRMYDAVSGSITIDGHDIKSINPTSLRRNIAIVSQEIFLFRGTLAENIKYSKPDATMDEVVAAAKAANAHDFIMSFKEGYDTMVGNGCRLLSGGQNQRISIARALLLAPSILILDEATAAMDTETERLIQDAITALSKQRTTISIAHRLSTLKDCNYLFVIEDGRIEEAGTPAELIAKKGMYYKLFTLQNNEMKKVLQGM